MSVVGQQLDMRIQAHIWLNTTRKELHPLCLKKVSGRPNVFIISEIMSFLLVNI